MADTQLAALSTEFVKVAVSASRDGVAIDVTGDPVSLAFVARGKAPVDADWRAGEWEIANTVVYARVLVGPVGGAVTLTAGSRVDVWVKITDSIEVPVHKAGGLQII